MKCKDCRYFFVKNPDADEGSCFRRPPRILVGNSRGTSVRCFRPRVNRNEFCGEFTPKEFEGDNNELTREPEAEQTGAGQCGDADRGDCGAESSRKEDGKEEDGKEIDEEKVKV